MNATKSFRRKRQAEASKTYLRVFGRAKWVMGFAVGNLTGFLIRMIWERVL